MLSGSKGVTPRSLNFLQKRGKVKFLFDMDGTLTARETLPMIAAHFGVQAPVADATIAAVTGREPFDQSLRQRVAALGHLPVDEVSRLVTTVPLHRLIVDFVNSHRDQCAIVTSNLDCWCDALMRKMGCEAFCSRAQITGNHVIGITELLHKEDVVDAYKADSREMVVFVGDGHNDLAAMCHADVAVAVGFLPGTPAASLAAVADHIFTTEKELCVALEVMAAGDL